MMNINPRLSIVLPTYNRAELLDYCLEVHIPLAKAHNIQIFIFDNASTDATEEFARKRIKEYPLIQYHKNETNLGPDKNFEIALNYPETEYIWLLGDSYKIPPDGIDYLLKLISEPESRPDVIVLNLANRIKNLKTQNFVDANSLLVSLGALMTCLSCLVYNKNLIKTANFAKYSNTDFVQTGIIFEAISNRSFTIHWAPSISVSGLKHRTIKKKPWTMTGTVFDIACVKWVKFVFLLPDIYALNNKFECISNFTKTGGVFSFRHLWFLRSEDILNHKAYTKYAYIFPLTIKYSKTTILLISLAPIGFARFLKIIYCYFRGS